MKKMEIAISRICITTKFAKLFQLLVVNFFTGTSAAFCVAKARSHGDES